MKIETLSLIDMLQSLVPNMMEQIVAPFFAITVTFCNDQPLKAVVGTIAGY